MYSIAQAVDEIVRSRTYLADLLDEGVLNISELARSMHQEVQDLCMKPVTVQAVAMAVRRRPLQPMSDGLERMLAEPFDIMVRSHIFEITVHKQSTLPRIQAVFADLTMSREHFFTITQGIYEDTILVSETYKDRVLGMFHSEDIVSQIEGLTAITVRLPPTSVDVPGLYHHILRGLALESINVVEIVSTYLECTLLFAGKDAQRAFAVLEKTLQHKHTRQS